MKISNDLIQVESLVYIERLSVRSADDCPSRFELSVERFFIAIILRFGMLVVIVTGKRYVLR